MPEQGATSGAGNQTTTTTQTVSFSCCCIPCCGGWPALQPNTLKLIGTLCAVLTLIFSALIVGIINNTLYVEQQDIGVCFYSLENSNCEYARFCGAFSIILSLIFCVIYGLRIKPIVSHPFLGTKAQLLGEIAAASTIAFFFGICAIVLSSASIPFTVIQTARAVSAFSYFTAFCWVVLAYVASSLYQYRESDASSSGGNPV